MYLQQIKISHIRSISSFQMDFKVGKEAGWHVLIGDNGSGKSSALRAIALALIGPQDVMGLRLPLGEWITKGSSKAEIKLKVFKDALDANGKPGRSPKESIAVSVLLSKEDAKGFSVGRMSAAADSSDLLWHGRSGWFSTSFGPFRRFAGGNKEWEKVYYTVPAAAPHLSVFGEDVALTESLEWLVKLKHQSLEQDTEALAQLEGLIALVNTGDLLPSGARLREVRAEGVFFEDALGAELEVNDLSDGYRSLLSMLFELVRQLIRCYGADKVFKDIRQGKARIEVPGVVMIDEVDAHLHPSWQTRVGEWLTQHFPAIQFIVTTHSALVCRASANGTIWRLDQGQVQQVTGGEKKQLLYGNVLDAYGTRLFGEGVPQSAKALLLEEERARLQTRKVFKGNAFSAEDQARLDELERLLP